MGILKQEREDRKSGVGPFNTAGSQARGPISSNKELVSKERTQVINKDIFIVSS